MSAWWLLPALVVGLWAQWTLQHLVEGKSIVNPFRRKASAVKDRPARHVLKDYDETKYQPRPVDPENPPKWTFYVPKRPDSMAFCSNCGDAFEEGDRALVFPNPQQGITEILCEDCVEKF